MLYSYLAVVTFAQQIAEKVGLRSGFGKPYAKWIEVQANIELLKGQAPQNGVSFAAYVMAIAQAKKYLDQRDKESIFSKTFNSDERHQYLDQRVEWCIKHFNQLKKVNPVLLANINPPVKLGAATRRASEKPLPIPPENQPSQVKPGQPTGYIDGDDLLERLFVGIDKKFTKMVREKAVDDFVDSEAFKKLKKYQTNILTTDLREHSYLCGLLDLKVDKASVLKKLIDDFETATTMCEIHQKLNNFYRGKVPINTEQLTPYQILNSGQNITTRFFGFFGMRTTTISLIDELVASLDPSTSPRFRI